MLDNLDKCYHVVCAIPVVQTVVGGAFAAKDILGIIKDIAMACLFPNYETNLKKNIRDLQQTTKALEKMQNQREILVNAAIFGDDEAKKDALKVMKQMQNDLKDMGMFFPSEFINKPNSTNYTEVGLNTHMYIYQAIIHCEKQISSLNSTLSYAEAVPAWTRITNLATNIISMIPTYRIGTVYNLGALAYHTFIKH